MMTSGLAAVAAAAPHVEMETVAAAPGSVFLMPVSCLETSSVQLTVLLLRLSLPAAQFEVLDVLPDAALSASGKSLDYEITGDTLSLCVFGNKTVIPSGRVCQLLLRLDPETASPDTLTPAIIETQGSDKDAASVTITSNNGAVSVLDGVRPHKADPNADWRISLGELLRIIQLYNTGAHHCATDTEDGFAPGPGDTDCEGHDADYNPRDWTISFEELLRMIQFYNAPYSFYHTQTGTEDGFAPGPFGILYDR